MRLRWLREADRDTIRSRTNRRAVVRAAGLGDDVSKPSTGVDQAQYTFRLPTVLEGTTTLAIEERVLDDLLDGVDLDAASAKARRRTDRRFLSSDFDSAIAAR